MWRGRQGECREGRVWKSGKMHRKSFSTICAARRGTPPGRRPAATHISSRHDDQEGDADAGIRSRIPSTISPIPPPQAAAGHGRGSARRGRHHVFGSCSSGIRHARSTQGQACWRQLIPCCCQTTRGLCARGVCARGTGGLACSDTLNLRGEPTRWMMMTVPPPPAPVPRTPTSPPGKPPPAAAADP